MPIGIFIALIFGLHASLQKKEKNINDLSPFVILIWNLTPATLHEWELNIQIDVQN